MATATTKRDATAKRGGKRTGKQRFLVALPKDLVLKIERRAFAKKVKTSKPFFRNDEIEFLVRRGLEVEGDAV